jgi:NADP-dependent 3-hydroxy acid dehydrogenase YdfG
VKGLDGKVCVVTGASSGIGQAVAVAFAGSGAHVWALGRNSERLGSAASRLERSTGQLTPVIVDLEQPTQIESAAAAILGRVDAVDVLVHSAGTISRGPIEMSDVDEFDIQYRVNLRAPFLLTRALMSALKRARGQIVFINSTAGAAPAPDAGLYSATKHGLRGLADSLRQEVNADGVHVLTVFPGRTATPMQESVHEHEGRPYAPELLIHAEDVAELVLAVLALPRTTEVTDIRLRPMAKLPEAHQ